MRCLLMEFCVQTYYKKEDLPPIEDVNFFHYASSFNWNENISYYKPLMLVVFEDEKPVAAMFALTMRINRFLYGSFFKRCYISQQPSFFEEYLPQIEIFDLLMKGLVKEVGGKVFFIEYRNISSAIFGYKGFRDNGFYSVKWISIKNSLQRKRTIWNQMSVMRKNQINKARRKGIAIEELTSAEKLPEIYKLVEEAKNWKITRRFPPYQYFENFYKYYILEGKGKILITRYHDKIIGGIILGFEQEKVYCLYYWGKDKTYQTIHPSVFTIYSAMEMAEENGYQSFDFMDAGFLNKRTGRPRFLLQFGGKQQASRRWYRINWQWLNFFANKIYD